MPSDGGITPPTGWTTEHIADRSARFRHKTTGVELSIRGVFQGSRERRHGRSPTHYVIQVHQGWLGRQRSDTQLPGAKVTVWEDALTTARTFMEEYSNNRARVPLSQAEAVHRSAETHETAEQILLTNVATEALADAAGYSDQLLIDVLSAATNNQYNGIVHRDGDAVDIVGEDADFPERPSLERVFATFPVDESGVKHLLDMESPVTMVVHLDELMVYRFIFGTRRETAVLLPRGTQVPSPGFERTVANVLTRKWA